MTRCSKCGAEIKYIPVSYHVDAQGTIAVEPEYTEVINDGGRVIKGHVRHRCRPSEEIDKLVSACHQNRGA
jgi:hypothetical protein